MEGETLLTLMVYVVVDVAVELPPPSRVRFEALTVLVVVRSASQPPDGVISTLPFPPLPVLPFPAEPMVRVPVGAR